MFEAVVYSLQLFMLSCLVACKRCAALTSSGCSLVPSVAGWSTVFSGYQGWRTAAAVDTQFMCNYRKFTLETQKMCFVCTQMYVCFFRLTAGMIISEIFSGGLELIIFIQELHEVQI